MKRVLTGAVAAVVLALASTPAVAAQVRTIVHFDIRKGQQAENLVVEDDGSAVVTFPFARQVTRVWPDGRMRVVASFASGGVSGIVRGPFGALYVLHDYDGARTGVYRIGFGQAPELVASVPDRLVPNGLAIDGDTMYVTASRDPSIWRIRDGGATEWVTAPILGSSSSDGYGIDGIKVHNGSVWVSHTEKGLLLRVPVNRDGSPGAIQTWASGLIGVDDFTFTGRGNEIAAAMITDNTVVLVRPGGTHQIVLTRQDGVSSPTSVAVHGGEFYVTDSAYYTKTDPNLLIAWR